MKNTIKNKNSKNFIWNLIGSSLYSFTSLFFMIIVTRINGVESAGIFTFAFSFICMIQAVGTYAGRTYQVTERNAKISDYDYLNFRYINLILMFICTIIYCFFKNYEPNKIFVILLLLIYRLIDAYSEVLFGIFQKNNNLYQVGISQTLRSIFTVTSFLVIDLITKNLINSLIGIICTDIVIFIFYDIVKYKQYQIKKQKFSLNSFKILIIGGFSVFIFTLLMQYVVNSPKFAIDDILSESQQAIFGIILMPATFMLLCSQFIINPFLYNINNALKNKQYKTYTKIVFKICLSILIVGILALIACYLIGIPILEILYNIDLEDHLYALLIIIAGSVIYGISSAISNALIAIRKNRIQVIMYFISSVFTFIASPLLVTHYEIIGACYSYFLTVFILFIQYLIYFIYITRKLQCQKLV